MMPAHGVPQPSSLAVPAASRRARALAAAALVLAVFATYANSLHAPFVFDDRLAILENPSIRQLWPPWAALSPPNTHVAGAIGRPLVNLSLALNYALGGESVWGYHLFNVLVHGLAAVALFAVVRRAFLLPTLRGRFGAAALPLAFAVALLWAVHPLQTETVTGVVQRNEAMMGLCLLLTLYGFLRAAEAEAAAVAGTVNRGALGWYALSVVAAFLGVGCKETMAVAPVLVLVFDRGLVADSWVEIWRRRRWYYAALAATWLWLADLMLAANQRGGTVGFGLGMDWRDYALTQCAAIVHYLRLSVWPNPLVLDYGTGVLQSAGAALPQMLLLGALLAGTAWALARRSPLGVLGAAFFLLLAPSSSVVPLTTQTMAEHRMYLPLAALSVLAVAGLFRVAGRRGVLPWAGGLAAALLFLTVERNADYRSAVAIWTQTVRAAPDNPRAYYNLGCALYEAGDFPAAAAALETAVRLQPGHADAHNNLGLAYLALGDSARAELNLRERLRLRPDDAIAHYNLGLALVESEREPEALAEFAAAVGRQPDYVEARVAWALALGRAGQLAPAFAQFQEAVRLEPDNFAARFNYANALFRNGLFPEAVEQYEAAVRLEPQNAVAQNNLGSALLQQGKIPEALVRYQTALRLRPDYADAQANYDRVRPLAEALKMRP